MGAERPSGEAYPWAGPALFVAVLCAVVVVFVWFLF
jgi:hypothetical protein